MRISRWPPLRRAALCMALASLVTTGEARADDWKPLPPSEYAFQALNLADMSTTLDIKNHPYLYEANPLLGRHPGDGAIIGLKLGEGAIHALVTEELIKRGASPRAVRIWEFIGIGIEGAAVGNNLSLGLHLKF